MEYNGWKNHQTWNVALWLNNSELYEEAVEFMKRRTHPKAKHHYLRFIKEQCLPERTPDSISWTGSRLDYEALDEMMKELVA